MFTPSRLADSSWEECVGEIDWLASQGAKLTFSVFCSSWDVRLQEGNRLLLRCRLVVPGGDSLRAAKRPGTVEPHVLVSCYFRKTMFSRSASLCLCMCARVCVMYPTYMCAVPAVARKGHWIFQNWSYRWATWCECRHPNPGPLQAIRLLTTKPSPQPLQVLFQNERTNYLLRTKQFIWNQKTPMLSGVNNTPWDLCTENSVFSMCCRICQLILILQIS